MTVREMKQMNSEIKKLLKKRERLRLTSENISPNISGMPPSGSSPDKIGIAVAEIDDVDCQLSQLRALRDYYLGKLSMDNDTELCIWLHLARGYSWRKIANLTDGRPDTADSIRKRCNRYVW